MNTTSNPTLRNRTRPRVMPDSSSPEPPRLVATDLDGTVIKESVAVLLAEELNRRGIFKEFDIWRRNQELFSAEGEDLNAAVRLQSNQYARGVQGLATSDVEEAALSLVPKVHFTRGFERVHDYLQSEGARTVLVTSSPYQALPAILSRFHFDVVLAFCLNTESGRFTGAHGTPMTSAVKRQLLSDLVSGREAHRSWGIGDRPEDLEAFSALGYRILLGNRSLTRTDSPPVYRVTDFDGVLALLQRGSLPA